MKKLSMHPLHIPFKRSFKHASAERSATQSVWVEAKSSSSKIGYGEGCPREYVTGESIASALKFFSAVHDEITAIEGLAELQAWVTANRTRIDLNPAAWCAIELALLDVFAQEADQPVEALLSLPPVNGPFHYTAVLGADELAGFQPQLARYRQMGFRDFKLKLAGDPAADQARIRAVAANQNAGDSLRLDANNLWSDAHAATAALRVLPGSYFGVEEPLLAGDYAGMRRIAEEIRVQIILDESFLRLDQFAQLSSVPAPWIINLRISKMGGLLRSLAIAERAAQMQVPVIIGCQVGETSLLTRAALTLAQAMRNKGLLAQEGAFGTYLLQNDVVERPLMFGAGGCLDVTSYNFEKASGFGLAGLIQMRELRVEG